MDLDIPADDELLQFAELFVPDISSSDPEERKLARQIRIQKRVDALQRQAQAQAQAEGEEAVEEKQPEKPTLLQIQLDKSGEILKQLFIESEEYVTNIRVANDAREVDRRETEGLGREKILKQLEEEAELANSMFNEISSKWMNIMQYNDPLHINDDILSQKEKCDELLNQKDGVINMLKLEVRLAEAKFYKDQTTQNEDISNLAKRVERQVIIMRKAHVKELQNIEDVMIQERTNMMENNDKRWEELYKKREEQELAISKNKFRQKEEFEAVTTAVRTKHMERIREVKIRLERDCEILQQEYESIKGAALSNSEKMDYNYQILRKREDENIIIKSNQKRKLNKLRDVINHLKKKINDYQTSTDNDMTKLFDDIIKLQKYISGVKSKSASLSLANEQKYMQVWELNRKAATSLLNKLLTIDKLLHEQQMGLVWEEPSTKLLQKEKLPSYAEAVKVMQAIKDKFPMKKENNDLSQFDDVEMTLAYRRTLNNVLERISDNSSFLIEFRLKKILEPVKDDENILLKVDNVFSALGITRTIDINIMLHFFRPYIKCPICSENKGNISVLRSETSGSDKSILSQVDADVIETFEYNNLSAVRVSDNAVNEIVSSLVDPARLEGSGNDIKLKEGECLGPTTREPEREKKVIQVTDYVTGADTSTTCLNNHQLVVNPTMVLRAVREFVTNVICTAEEEKKSSVPNLAKHTLTLSRLINQSEVTEYWNRYQKIIGKDKIELWDSLLYGLEKYHAILEDRHKLHETLKCLRRQNMELKHLLGKYKTEDMKPPCARQREIPITEELPVRTCTPVSDSDECIQISNLKKPIFRKPPC